MTLSREWKEHEFDYVVEENVFALQLIVYVPPAKANPRIYGPDWHALIDDISVVRHSTE